jgi:hypothetical protein
MNPRRLRMPLATRLIVLAFALLALASKATAQDYCLPKSDWIPIHLQGGVLMEGRDNVIKGDWRAIWCASFEQRQDGASALVWRLRTFAVLDKYKTMDATGIAVLLGQVLSSSNPVASLSAMIKAREVIPPVGSQDRFDWESLLFTACKQGVALPPIPYPVIDNCEAPIPPTSLPVSTATHVVTGAQAFPLKPDGTRSITPISAAPIKGEDCDCTGANKVLQYGATFCKVPRLSTTQTIVAGCSLKKP